MNIPEAIRLKQLTGDEFLKADPDELDLADSLSIEALKRLQDLRAMKYVTYFVPLPGETEK